MEERGKKEGLGRSRGQREEKRGEGKRGERGEGEGDGVHQQSRSEETPNERADKEAKGKCIYDVILCHCGLYRYSRRYNIIMYPLCILFFTDLQHRVLWVC